MKLILFLLLVGTHLFANCPIPGLSSQNLNEEGVRRFVNQFAAAKLPLEDFACCLPQVFQNHYIVAHSSFAGQDSIPQSPRVIMTNLMSHPNGGVQLPTAFFSINGGHSSLRQTQSVEMALVNSKTGKADFFDINFNSGHAQMSAANPSLCLACHGTRGQYGATGTHLIFDGPIIWPRFVNGLDLLPRLENHPTSPELSQYINRLQRQSVKALTQNPRFKCLSTKIPDVGFLNTLDLAIGKLNSIKTSSEIVNSIDYGKFKYAVFGAEQCKSMIGELNQWIHPRTLNSLNQLTNIFNPIKDLNQNDQMDAVALQAFNNRKHEIVQTINNANQNQSVEKVSFEFRRGFVDMKEHILPANLKGIVSPIIRKYAIDNELRGSQVNLLVRFLFEARGIPISQWSTDVVAGYQRSGVQLDELLKYESANSPIRQALNGNRQQTCQGLRNLSFKATE